TDGGMGGGVASGHTGGDRRRCMRAAGLHVGNLQQEVSLVPPSGEVRWHGRRGGGKHYIAMAENLLKRCVCIASRVMPIMTTSTWDCQWLQVLSYLDFQVWHGSA